MLSISLPRKVESSKPNNVHHSRSALKLFIIPTKTTIPRGKRKSDPPWEVVKTSKGLSCLSRIFGWKSKAKMDLEIKSVAKHLKISPILVWGKAKERLQEILHNRPWGSQRLRLKSKWISKRSRKTFGENCSNLKTLSKINKPLEIRSPKIPKTQKA